MTLHYVLMQGKWLLFLFFPSINPHDFSGLGTEDNVLDNQRHSSLHLLLSLSTISYIMHLSLGWTIDPAPGRGSFQYAA